MKKIIKLGLLLTIMMYSFMGAVYATLSCNMSIEPSKTEVNKTEEFTVDFKIINMQADPGIIALGATLEYDKTSFELVKMEGKNGWDNPSYNNENGIMVMTRNDYGKSDETVFTATFKAKASTSKTFAITLKNITVADGDKPVNVSDVSINISVKDSTTEPTTPGTPDTPSNPTDPSNPSEPSNPNNPSEPSNPNNPNNPSNPSEPNNPSNPNNPNNNGDGNQSSNTDDSKNQNAVVENVEKNKDGNKILDNLSSNPIPKAGRVKSVIIVFIGIASVIAVVFFVKMKKCK